MNVLKAMMCYARAVKDLVLRGIWVPHLFGESEYERCIVISTRNGFRTSQSLEHANYETVHPDACLVKSRCIYCGKQDVSWVGEWNDAIRMYGNELRRSRNGKGN